MTAKFWTFLITTLLLVTGCSKSEVVTSYEQVSAGNEYTKQQPTQQEVNNNPVPIIFDVASGDQATTRALTTEDILKQDGNGFGVFAYYTHGNYPASNSNSTTEGTDVYPNFMYNQRVYWNTALDPDAWDYAPTKYWPNDISTGAVDNQTPDPATGSSTDKLSFFAYGPYTSSVTLGTTTYTLEPSSGRFKNGSAYYDAQDGADGILKFESNATARDPRVYYRLGSAASQDLVYGTALKDKTKMTGTPTFAFNHALAALKFYVGGNFDAVSGGTINDDTYITIESVDIEAIDLPYMGWLNLNSGTWEDQDTSTDVNPATIHLNTEDINEPLRFTGKDDDPNKPEAEWDTVNKKFNLTGNWHPGVGRVISDPVPSPVLPGNGGPAAASAGTTYPLMNKVGGLDQYVMVMPSATSVTFKITCNYHVWTLDKRNADCISKVENNVTNKIIFAPDLELGKDAIKNGNIYAITIWLGMTSVKLDVKHYTNKDTTGSEHWPTKSEKAGNEGIFWN
jgi:hypothetical protein